MWKPMVMLGAAVCCVGIAVADDPSDLQPGVRPREEVHLYLLIGQSNMAGRAEVEDVDRVPHPRVFSFTQEQSWVPAIDPLHSDRSNAGLGLGSKFGRVMAESNSEITIGLIPSAVGGTPLRRWEKGGDLWQQAIERTRAVQKTGQLKGILWHQGEADGLEQETAETYAPRLSQMVEALREELGDPDLPFVAGKLGEFLPENRRDGQPAYWPIVNGQIATLPELVEGTAVVESTGLTDLGDAVHFDAASLRTFGQRYAVAMKSLQSRRASEE